jgi:hypothetical protein
MKSLLRSSQDIISQERLALEVVSGQGGRDFDVKRTFSAASPRSLKGGHLYWHQANPCNHLALRQVTMAHQPRAAIVRSVGRKPPAEQRVRPRQLAQSTAARQTVKVLSEDQAKIPVDRAVG